ncbi:hypothetical protein Lal_00033440 [Lupinus albus]|nr:hypothetical protein Lal_00033440 [Lupinus albus]
MVESMYSQPNLSRIQVGGGEEVSTLHSAKSLGASLALKQIGSVVDYVEEFEKYVGALREIDQKFVRDIFLNGLKEEIKAEVKLHEHQTLSKKIVPNNYSRCSNFVRNFFPSKIVTVEAKSERDRRPEHSPTRIKSSLKIKPTKQTTSSRLKFNQEDLGEILYFYSLKMID